MQKKENKKGKKLLKRLLLLLVKIIIIILIFVILFHIVYGVKRISGLEMYPNIKQGDLILYYRLANDYEDGDAVLIHKDGKDAIMRIVAKEGETVRISEGKAVVNNLIEVKESFYKTEENKESDIRYPYTVKPGKYFVMYDYRSNKNDSRTFGAIDEDEIKGKVISRLQIRNV